MDIPLIEQVKRIFSLLQRRKGSRSSVMRAPSRTGWLGLARLA
jgi:hypothetical protein